MVAKADPILAHLYNTRDMLIEYRDSINHDLRVTNAKIRVLTEKSFLFPDNEQDNKKHNMEAPAWTAGSSD